MSSIRLYSLILSMVAVLIGAALSIAQADVSESEIDLLFRNASVAYDAGRMADAIADYEAILSAGYDHVEVLFNAGNAYFRSGEIGQAILHYRRAWHLSPSDPDIEANMRFAAQHTGAALPEWPRMARLFLSMRVDVWSATARIAYWLLAGCLILHLFARKRTTAALRAAWVCIVVLMIASVGVMYWRTLEINPEYVVIDKGQKVLFAPLLNSTEHFALPEGSIIRAEEQSDGWLKVTVDSKSGWIPASHCKQVYPWSNDV